MNAVFPVPSLATPIRRGLGLAAVLLGFTTALQAQQPTGGTVVAGQATIATTPGLTTITAGNDSVLRWGSFNVGAGEGVQFVQPGADSRVLNWIGGNAPSQINGSLLANGQVYLMNPSGVYFGQSAVINVGGMYAVGGTITKEDFLSGLNRFTGLTGEVQNAGSIRGDFVALVGRSVANTGSIVSPGGFISLAAGEQVLLGRNGSNIYVEAGRTSPEGTPATGTGVANSGTIDAGSGSTVLAAGDLYSVAITQGGRLVGRDIRLQGQGRGDVLVSGTIDASATVDNETGGRVEITGERVGLMGNARIEASGPAGGGTILVGGDFQGSNADVRNSTHAYVGAGASLVADAGATGPGGKVIVWADDVTRFMGNISARGGALGGNGGFAEVSGKGFLEYRGFTDLTAPLGATGTLLLDPQNITIAAATPDLNGDTTTGDDLATAAIAFADAPGAGTSIITAGAVVTQLDSADVVLQATQDIAVNAAIDASGNTNTHSLTMQAGRDINVAAAITTHAGGAIRLEADSPHSTAGAANGTGTLTIGAQVSSGGGQINLIGSAFSITQDVNAGAGGINLTVARTNVTLDLGATVTNAQINHLLTTGTLQLGQATTGGANGLTPTTRTAQDIDVTATFSIGATSGSAVQLRTNNGFTASESLTTAQALAINSDFDANGSGDFTVANTKTVSSGGLALSITAEDLILSTTGALNSGAGATTIIDSNGTGIGLGSNATANGLNITGAELQRITANGLTLQTAGDITIDNITAANSNNISGTTTITGTSASSDIDISGTASTFNALALNAAAGIVLSENLVTDTGGITANADTDATGGGVFDVANGVTVTTNGQALSITADNLDLNTSGALDSGAGATTIVDSDGTGIGLGGTAVSNGLNITGAELLLITATDLTLQTAGNITVDGITGAQSQNIAGTTTLTGDGATSAITFTGAASTFNALALNATTGITVNENVTTDTGGITANADTDATGGGTFTVAATTTVSTGGQALSLTANDVNLNATGVLNSGAGAASIIDSDGTGIDLGTATTTGGLALTNAELTNITSGGLTLQTTGDIAVNGVTGAATTNTGTVTLTPGGAATISIGAVAGDSSTFTGGVIATGGADKDIAGTIAAAGVGVINLGTNPVNVLDDTTVGGTSTGQITLGATTLADDATLTLGAGAASPITAGSVTGTGGGGVSDLVINVADSAALPAVSVGAVGTDIDTVTVTQSSGTTFTGAVGATTVTLTDTRDGSSISFQGGLTANALNTFNQGYNVSLGASSTITTDTTFANTGSVTLGGLAGDVMAFTGGLDTTAASGTSVAGTISTSAADIDLGAVTVIGNTTLDSGGSNITVGAINADNAATADRTLAINAGAGEVTLGGSIGATQALADLDVTGTTINLNGAAIKVDDQGGNTVNFNGVVILGNDVAIDANGATANSMAFSSTIDADDEATADRKLTVDAGTGAVTFADSIGAGANGALADLDVTGATITLNGSMVKVDDQGGNTATFTGGVTLANDVTVDADGAVDNNVAFASTIDADALANDRKLTVNADTGTTSFANVGATEALADFDVTGSTINLSGASVAVNAGAGGETVNLTGAVVLGNSVTINTTGTGDNHLTFGSTIDADNSTTANRTLTITAGGATVRFDGSIGAGTNGQLADLDISAGSIIIAGAVVRLDDDDATAATADIDGVVTLENSVSFDTDRTGAGDSSLHFTGAIDATTAGTEGLTVTAGTGTVTFDDNLGGGTALGAVSVAGGTINLNSGSLFTQDGQVDLSGAVKLATSLTIDTIGGGAGANINFNTAAATINGTTAGAESLTLNAGTGAIKLEGAAGGTVALGAVTLNGSAITLSANLQTEDGQVDLNAPVTLGGTAGINTVGAGGGADINFNGATIDDTSAGANSLTLNAGTGTVKLDGDIGTGVAIGGLDVTGAAITLNSGNIMTEDGQVALNGPVAMATSLTIDTVGGGTGANINLTSTIDGTTTGAETLTLNAGTGGITLAGVGTNTNLGQVTISGGGTGTLGGDIITDDGAGANNANVDLSGFTGSMAMTTSVTINTDGQGDGTNGSITLGGTIDGTTDGAETLTLNAGNAAVSLTNAGTTTNLGGVTIITSGLTTLSGSIVTDDGAGANNAIVDLGSATGGITLGGNVSINTDGQADDSGGDVILSGSAIDGTSAGSESLAIAAGSGDVAVPFDIGATTALASLSISGNDISLLSLGVTGAISITSADATADSGQLILNGTTYSTDGSQSYTGGSDGILLTAGTPITFTTSADNISFTGTTTLSDGADLTVTTSGSAPGSGDITFGTIRANSFEDVTLLANSANVTVGAIGSGDEVKTINISGATITLGGNITTADAAGNTVGLTGAVVLANDVTIDTDNATNDGSVTFASTVNSEANEDNDLTVSAGSAGISVSGAMGGVTNGEIGAIALNSTASTSLGGAVTAASLTTNAGGTTSLAGGSVTTTGVQNYGDPVDLSAAGSATTLTGTNIFFAGTVRSFANGVDSLTVTGSGTTTFTGAVGDNNQRLASLTSNGGGTTLINGTTVTTTGGQTYTDAVELDATGDVTSLTGTNISFAGTLRSATDGVEALIVTGSGATTFGGAVGDNSQRLASLTSNGGGTTALNGGGVTTTGAQSYSDAVTLDAAGNSTTLTGTNISFAGTIRSTTDGQDGLTITGSGATGVGGAIGDNGQRLASFTTNGGGTTELDGGIVNTTGAQTYTDALILSSGGANTLTGTNISFASTVRSFANGVDSLTITGSGTTTFSGAVGDNGQAFASLTSNGGGTTAINGVTVTTTGGQTYTDAVTLNAAGDMTQLTGTNISFGSTLRSTTDGEDGLIVAASGTTTFSGAVGDNSQRLASLTTNSGGSTAINGASVNTTGAQSYNEAVTLDAAGNTTTLTGTNISFASTLRSTTDGQETLTITGSGTTAFGGAVGDNTQRLASLTTNGGGTTEIDGGGVTTTGGQTYTDAVVLAVFGTTTMTGTNISFGSTVRSFSDGVDSLVVTGSGTTTFGGAVGDNSQRLSTLTSNGGGTTAINGGAVTTTGAQTYTDAVTLNADTTLTATSVGFASTVNSLNATARALTVDTSGGGATTFSGAVGTTFALSTLTTNADGTTAINGGAVTTSGGQTYNDAVTFDATGNATTLAGTNIAFNSTVRSTTDGEEALTITGSGTTSFATAVGDNSQRFASLTSNGGGSTQLGGNVTTTGAQNYADAVRLDVDVTLATTDSPVTFGSTIDSEASEANDLTINTGTAAVTFGGAIGGALNGQLGTLTINNTAGGVVLSSMTVQSLNLTTNGAITDAPGTALTVTGLATLNAGSNAITLGDNGGDTTNFGSINLTGSTVTVTEDSAMNIDGLAATAATLTASGAIDTTGTATLATTGLLTLNAGANAVTIAAGDTANFGSISLTGTTIAVTEDSAMTLAGLSGATTTLTANGAIDTTGSATLTNSGLLTLNAGANAITIVAGDTANFGSVNLTGTTVSVTEDSGMSLNGLSATTGSLTASGTIAGTGTSTLTTTGLLTLNAGANAITIAAGDTANFGSVNLTGTTVAVNEDSAMTVEGLAATTATLVANGAIDTSGTATLSTTGLLTLDAGANAITIAGGDTANFGSVNLTGTTVAVAEDSAMTLNGLAATSASLSANGAIDTTGAATLTTTGLLTLNAGANAITIAAGDTANFGSVNLTGTTVTVAEDSAMTVDGLAATTATLTANGAIDTTGAATLSTTALLTLNAGANAITVAAGDTANFGSVNLTGTTVAVTEDSAMTINALSATAATLVANGAIDTTGTAALGTTGLLTLDAGANAVTIVSGDTANFGSVNLTGTTVSVVEDSAMTLNGLSATTAFLTANGAIDTTGTAALGTTGLLTLNAGANAITITAGDTANFGSVSLTGTTVAVNEDSAMTISTLSATTATLVANGAIDTTGTAALGTTGLLTLDAGANAITIVAGDTANFGSVNLTGTTVTVTEDSGMSLNGLSATSASLTASGPIAGTGTATLTTTGLLTLNAGANTITIAAGDTANFGSVDLTGTTVAVTEDSAMTLAGLSSTTATITANGAIDTTGTAILSSTGLLTMDAGANAITIVAGDTANFGSVNLTGTAVAVSEDSAMTITNLSATSAALTANGAIDTTGTATLTTTGLMALNAGANAVTIAAGDTANFGSLSATGTTISVIEDSAMTLAGLNGTTTSIIANGAIDTTGTATLTNTGLITLNAGSNAITIAAGDTANFGSVNLTGTAVAVSEDSAMTVNNLSATTATLTANGAIDTTGTATVTTTGLLTLDAGANGVTIVAGDTANFGSVNLTGTTVSVIEDSAMTLDGLSATSATLTANGAINTTGTATLTSTGLLTLNAGANAITIAAGDTANFGSVNLTGTTVAVIEDSDMTINGLSSTTATITANGAIDTTGTAAISTTGLLTLDAGANAITITAGDTANFGSVNITGGAVAVTEDSAMTITNLSATSAALTANGAIDTTGTATLTTTGLLALNAGTNAVTIAAGDTANFGSVDLTGTTISVIEDSAMTLAGLSSTTATITANGAIDTTGTAILSSTGLLTMDAGANAITIVGGDTANFGSVNLTGTAVAVTEDSAMTITNLSATSAALTANGAIDTTGTATLTTTGLMALNAGANAVTIAAGDTANFGSLSATGTTISVIEDSAMTLAGLNGTTTSIIANGAIDTTGSATLTNTGLITLNAGSNAITIAAGDTANFGLVNLTGTAVAVSEDSAMTVNNLSATTATLTANGAIDTTGTATVTATGLLTLNAGANPVTIVAGDTANFGSVNLTGSTISVIEDSAMTLAGLSAATTTLAANGAIDTTGSATLTNTGLLTLNTGANAITIAAGDTANFGSVNLTGTTVAVTEDGGMTINGLSATSATLNANGAIDTTGAATVTTSGLLTLNAGANAITIASGDTANFGALNITGGAVTVTEDSATDLALVNAGAFTLTSGGHITESGLMTVTGQMTLAVTTPLSDILLDTQANDLGTFAPIFTGTTANIHDLRIRNINAGALAGVLSNLTNLHDLTITYDNAPIDLSGLTASGTLNITAGGMITDSGPSIVPGLSNFNSNGFNIILNDLGNNFGTVSLNGGSITLFNVSSISLAGVQATGTFSLTSLASLTVSSTISTSSGVDLQSVNGDLLIDAPVNAGGTLLLQAGQRVLASAPGTVSAGGALTVTAGTGTQMSSMASSNGGVTVTTTTGNANLSAIDSSGGSVTIDTRAGATSFLSPLTISGPFLVKSSGNVDFGQGIGGVGNSALEIRTPGVTRFSGAVNGLNSLLTDSAGSTIIAGGTLAVSGTGFRFNDPVTIGADTLISGTTGRFDNTVRGLTNGGQTLSIDQTGDTIFMAAVGDANLRLGGITTVGSAGATRFYSGSVATTGAQVYNDAVQLGSSATSNTTIFEASNLTFNGSLNMGPARSTLLPSASGLNEDSSDNGLLANVSGATIFNGAVGQLLRIGDVVTNAAGTTEIHADFSAASITLNDPSSFISNNAININTSGLQRYAGLVTLGSNPTFVSTLSETFPAALGAEANGINFVQGVVGAGRTLTATATSSAITVGGDIGTTANRLTSVVANGRYMVVAGSIYTTGDIKLGISTVADNPNNDFLQFTGPSTGTTHTWLDSTQGEIVLGSGATGGTAKTGAPLRASIFKSNTGDLYLFGRKVTVQPFERLVVRNGSFIGIADGTAAGDSITLSNTAASNYLVVVSSMINGITFRSRAAATVQALDGTNFEDRGTDLIAGAVLFYINSTSFNSVAQAPTRTTYVPAPAASSAPGFFNYTTNTGNIQPALGQSTITILSDGQAAPFDVFVADLLVTNSFRPTRTHLIYLDLSTVTGFGNFTTGFIDPELVGLSIGAPMRTLSSRGAASRTTLQQAFTPNVPREDTDTAPPEVDLSLAVREQLQALGIYARALRPAERLSRELRMGLFVTVPERERPRESDYEVADARVEDRSVREVIRLATETGLIGENQNKLNEVARSLQASFEAFTAVSTKVEATDFRAWLETSQEADAVRVLAYVKDLQETLRRIELLGLTRQELASSKAQIYGSILRARLNTEPEFLRTLVEGAPAAARVTMLDQGSGQPDGLAMASTR